MLIDWFTVGAQAINFIILIWLLKRFLYGPILRAIDARERRIETELADAAAKQAEAEKERTSFRQKNAAFDRQHDERMARMDRDIRDERSRLLDEARSAADALSARRKKALMDEAKSLNDAIVGRVQEEAFRIAERVLGDLAGESIEACLVDIFVQRLSAMAPKEKTEFSKAISDGGRAVQVNSAVALTDSQKTAVRQAVQGLVRGEIDFRFEIRPGLIGGIELIAQGHRLAWSISDYLTSLEKSVGDLLARENAT